MEQRLIDAEELCKLARNHIDGTVDCNDIMRFPTVDVVPVVLRGECKKWNRYKDGIKGLCGHTDHVMQTSEYFYCADGERKERTE